MINVSTLKMSHITKDVEKYCMNFGSEYKDSNEFRRLVPSPDVDQDNMSEYSEDGLDWDNDDTPPDMCRICKTAKACCIKDCKFTVVSEDEYRYQGREHVLCPKAWCHNCMVEYKGDLYCNRCGSMRPWEHPYDQDADHCRCPGYWEQCAYCDFHEDSYGEVETEDEEEDEEESEEVDDDNDAVADIEEEKEVFVCE